MVTSPQDHWMIKEKILKFEGKRKNGTKFGPIREILVKKWQFFEKTRQKCQGGVSQPKERGEKDRERIGEGVGRRDR